MFWKLCEAKVDSDRQFVGIQHVYTEKHKRAVVGKDEKNTNSEVQRLVTNTPKKCLFSHDLCIVLLSANIPLYETRKPSIKIIFENVYV